MDTSQIPGVDILKNIFEQNFYSLLPYYQQNPYIVISCICLIFFLGLTISYRLGEYNPPLKGLLTTLVIGVTAFFVLPFIIF